MKAYLRIEKLREEYISESYVCPLSFRVYKKEQLEESFEDQLTAEPALPDSLMEE